MWGFLPVIIWAQRSTSLLVTAILLLSPLLVYALISIVLTALLVPASP